MAHYHFLGLGGIGMSALARWLLHNHHQVSGADLSDSDVLHGLRALGAVVTLGHTGSVPRNCDAVVVSSAIAHHNPDYQQACALGLPIVHRGALLAEWAGRKRCLAVAGSHGKTTTASLLTHVLHHAGWNPSYAVGGLLASSGINADWTDGDAVVVEADESDASFLHMHPELTVLTNMGADHLDHYQQNMGCLTEAFGQFVAQTHGCVVLNADDQRLWSLRSHIDARVVGYGQHNPDADYRLHACDMRDDISYCRVQKNGEWWGMELAMPGVHQAFNALAVWAAADVLGIDSSQTLEALRSFPGVGRRFQRYRCGSMRVVDDYGHHPTEIQATLHAVRACWPDRRLVMVFQPHRYTRTQALFDDFVGVLGQADVLLLLDVYAAHESPIAGADSDALAAALSHTTVVRVHSTSEVVGWHHDHAEAHDVWLMQGAGSVGKMVPVLLEAMHAAL